MSKIVLCISANEATAARWSAGKLRAWQRFDASNEGLDAFRAWLAPQRGNTAWITVDTPDEEYRLETVPHVSARQRFEMLERKLQQLYRGSQFRAGGAVRSVRGKRREDQCLMAAYADERVLLPWIDALQRAGLLIAAIHPVPLLLVDMLRRARAAPDPVLLVMRWSGGIRQTVLSDNIPLLTRVTSIHDETRVAQLAAEEIRGTREYLGALGILSSDRTLPVFVLDPTLRLVDDPGPSLIRLAPLPVALAKSIGVAVADAPPGTRLQLILLARHCSRINLAPPALRAPLRRRNSARLIAAVSLCIGLFCATVATVQAIDAMRAMRQRVALNAALRNAASVTPDPKQALAAITPDFDRMLRQLSAQGTAAHAAHRVYLAISRALDAYPQFTLESLRWEQRAIQADSASVSGDSNVVAVARMTLQSTGDDPREALRAMQSFAAAIARVTDVERAQLTAVPPGFDAAGTLRGQFTPTRSGRSALAFETTVQFRRHDVQD